MVFRTPKDGGENALWDGNRHAVTLVYDEENDVLKMLRANENGELIVIGSVVNYDGDTISLSGETQNNQNKLFVNHDDLITKLDKLETQLKIMNFHLGNITDVNLTKDDLGES